MHSLVNKGNVGLRVESELLYKNLSKVKGIKTAKHAKAEKGTKETIYKSILHGRDSNSRTSTVTPTSHRQSGGGSEGGSSWRGQRDDYR
jgi:hypothetical protein